MKTPPSKPASPKPSMKRWSISSFRSVYDRCPTLQNIPSATLVEPSAVVDWLVANRKDICRELGPPRLSHSRYALNTFVQALEAGGKLEIDSEPFTRLAGSRDLYERSQILQNINDEVMATPEQLVAELVQLKPSILQEQQELLSDSPRAPRSYEIVTLVMALEAGNRIPRDHQTYKRMASARDLYDSSDVLQSIPDSVLVDLESTVDELIRLGPAVAEEVGTSTNYAPGTLMQALIMGGRLGKDMQTYTRHAGAQRLYERSPILNGIEDDVLSDPMDLIDELVRLRPAIMKEQDATHYALGTLVLALFMGGRLERNPQVFSRLAGADDLYNRSPILQGIDAHAFSDPPALIDELVRLRPSILKEQRAAGKKVRGYALATLALALYMDGQLEGDPQIYARLASGRDLHDGSPILQAVSDESLSNSDSLFEELRRIRPRVLEEQRAAGKKVRGYALSTLAQALAAGGRLTKQVQGILRQINAHEFYDRSKILQSITKKQAANPRALIARLSRLRPSILDEQRRARNQSAEKLKSLSLATFVQALVAGNKIGANEQVYMRMASAYDLYARSPILRGFDPSGYSSPIQLFDKLVDLRPRIIREQRGVRDIADDEPLDYALATLTQALDMGGVLRGASQTIQRLAGARDLYDRSPALQAVTPDLASDAKQLMRYLLTHRDRVAVENARSKDDLKPDAFTIPHAENHYALGTLVGALYAGGVIEENQFASLRMNAASPLQYVVQRWSIIESQIRKTGIVRYYSKHIDRSVFTRLDDPMREVGYSYLKNIVQWGRWFLNDDTAVRSIFGADEIAFMALASFGDHIAMLSEDVPERLIQAGYLASKSPVRARRDAIEALRDTLNIHAERAASREVSGAQTAYAMQQIEQLVHWNNDAIAPASP